MRLMGSAVCFSVFSSSCFWSAGPPRASRAAAEAGSAAALVEHVHVLVAGLGAGARLAGELPCGGAAVRRDGDPGLRRHRSLPVSHLGPSNVTTLP